MWCGPCAALFFHNHHQHHHHHPPPSSLSLHSTSLNSTAVSIFPIPCLPFSDSSTAFFYCILHCILKAFHTASSTRTIGIFASKQSKHQQTSYSVVCTSWDPHRILHKFCRDCILDSLSKPARHVAGTTKGAEASGTQGRLGATFKKTQHINSHQEYLYFQ